MSCILYNDQTHWILVLSRVTYNVTAPCDRVDLARCSLQTWAPGGWRATAASSTQTSAATGSAWTVGGRGDLACWSPWWLYPCACTACTACAPGVPRGGEQGDPPEPGPGTRHLPPLPRTLQVPHPTFHLVLCAMLPAGIFVKNAIFP